MSSLILDYVPGRRSLARTLKYFLLKQLPVLPPDCLRRACVAGSHDAHSRGLDPTTSAGTVVTAWDMEPFARDLGDDGPPFRWDEERRTLIRAELDAAYFHLYGLERDEVEHVMDSFDALRRREEKRRTSASSAPSG